MGNSKRYITFSGTRNYIDLSDYKIKGENGKEIKSFTDREVELLKALIDNTYVDVAGNEKPNILKRKSEINNKVCDYTQNYRLIKSHKENGKITKLSIFFGNENERIEHMFAEDPNEKPLEDENFNKNFNILEEAYINNRISDDTVATAVGFRNKLDCSNLKDSDASKGYLLVGKILIKGKNYDVAETALREAKKRDRENLEIDLAFCDLYWKQGSMDNFKKVLRRNLSDSRAINMQPSKIQADVYGMHARFAQRYWILNAAIKYYLRELDCFNDEHNYNHSMTLSNLALMYKRIGNTKEARFYYKQAEETRRNGLKKNSEKYKKALAITLSNYALYLCEIAENAEDAHLGEALNKIDEAIRLKEELPNSNDKDYSLALSYDVKGCILGKGRNFPEARKFFKDALEKKENLNKQEHLNNEYEKSIATTYHNMAYYLSESKEDRAKVVKAYEEAIKRHKELHELDPSVFWYELFRDYYRYGSFLTSNAFTYKKEDNEEVALEQFKNAYQIGKENMKKEYKWFFHMTETREFREKYVDLLEKKEKKTADESKRLDFLKENWKKWEE